MRKYIFSSLLFLVLALCCPASSWAQFTTVTAQVLDPNGNLYQNCHGEADFVPSPTATTQPFLSGSLFQTSVVINQCDGNANMSVVLADNNQVSDGHSTTLSQWRFTVCSSTSVANPPICFSYTGTITGATQNLTAALKAVSAPLPVPGNIAVGVTGNLAKYGTPSQVADSGIAANNVPTLNGNNALTGNETHSGTETFSGSEVITGPVSGNRTDSGNVAFSGTNLFGNVDKTCIVDGTRNATIAAAITDCGTNSVVYIPKGTYTLAAALAPVAVQRLWCDDGATITQGSAANLTALVNFSTNSANGASIQNCTLDGNMANNTLDLASGHYLIQVGSANDVTVQHNTLQNAPSVAVSVTTGLRPKIIENLIRNVTTIGVALFTGAAFTATNAQVHDNTFKSNLGYFVIGLQFSDDNTISRNHINATQSVQVVNTSGTTVTYVSGTNFAGLAVGMICRITGTEYQITAIASNTSMTIASTAGTQTNANSVCGTADLINVDSSSGNVISANELLFGMSGGVVIHQSALGAESAVGNNVSNNEIANTGGSGIGVASLTGTPTVDSTNVSGNTVLNAAIGHLANTVAYGNGGISLNGPNTNGTQLSDNVVRDFNTFTSYGIYVNSDVPIGTTRLGLNLLTGATNTGSSGGSWTTYVPVITAGTGTFTTVSATGRYFETGKRVDFEIAITITTNGTAAASVIASLPFTNNATAIYTVSGRANAISGKQLQAYVVTSGTTIVIVNYDGTYPGASGESLIISGFYERL